MRLIDADALKIRDISPDIWVEVDGVTAEDIKDAPTIKAIPIEFIQEVINDYKGADQWDYAHALDMLIGYWKAENND